MADTRGSVQFLAPGDSMAVWGPCEESRVTHTHTHTLLLTHSHILTHPPTAKCLHGSVDWRTGCPKSPATPDRTDSVTPPTGRPWSEHNRVARPGLRGMWGGVLVFKETEFQKNSFLQRRSSGGSGAGSGGGWALMPLTTDLRVAEMGICVS